MSDSKDYPNYKVAIDVNDKPVNIPVENNWLVKSMRDGKEWKVSDLADMYKLHGNWADIQRETGISDKTVKRHVMKFLGGMGMSTTELHSIVEENKRINQTPAPKRSKNAVNGTKAAKLVSGWFSSNAELIDATLGVLFKSLTDPQAISRAPLRDRAIAFGIVTEKLQKQQELGIRQQEVNIKRAELTRKDAENELRAREIAALEKGVTINIGRQMQDVTEFVPVAEVPAKPNEGSNE